MWHLELLAMSPKTKTRNLTPRGDDISGKQLTNPDGHLEAACRCD